MGIYEAVDVIEVLVWDSSYLSVVLVIRQAVIRKRLHGEPSYQVADFASTELALGDVNRACVAEAADRGGEPSSGGGGIAVEQFEDGLRNFG